MCIMKDGSDSFTFLVVCTVHNPKNHIYIYINNYISYIYNIYVEDFTRFSVRCHRLAKKWCTLSFNLLGKEKVVVGAVSYN